MVSHEVKDQHPWPSYLLRAQWVKYLQKIAKLNSNILFQAEGHLDVLTMFFMINFFEKPQTLSRPINPQNSSQDLHFL